MSDKRVVVIAGPTASGKTALGIAAAQALHSEIVSADSMQVYRGMDIGTAKAGAAEQKAAKHYMIDVAEPRENYSVARYVKEASLCCDRLLSEGKTPVIVGGTGLYIDSLLAGRDFGRQEEDETLRKRLNEDYEREGGEKLLEKLRSFDPERAALLHPADRKRIIRAMEVYYLSGETITEHDRKTREMPPRYEAMVLIPGFRDRALLYERIDRRVEEMVQRGLFDEVKRLLDAGISTETTAMQAIGYKEAIEAVNGIISREEAVTRIQMASRRYAKRQLTWFSGRKDALRLYHDDPGGTEQLTKEALQEIGRWVYDDTIADNIASVREEIELAAQRCGRKSEEITLVAASKMNDTGRVREAAEAGIAVFGENRVQEMTEKNAKGAYEGAHLHFIGRLQRNKVKQVVGVAELIHGADSLALLQEIGRKATDRGLTQDVLLEVNIGREQTKAGFAPEEVPVILEKAEEISGVRIRGLMAIPPIVTSEEEIFPYFSAMQKLFVDNGQKKYDNSSMDFLSMGMSHDFAQAIICGSNMVRIGTKIFGPRNYGTN